MRSFSRHEELGRGFIELDQPIWCMEWERHARMLEACEPLDN